MKVSLTLSNKKSEPFDVKSFIFRPNTQFNYQAGQFLRYTLKHKEVDDRGDKRYFTISSAPSEGLIQLTTKFADNSSSFKKALDNLKLGELIEAEGPMGDFIYDGQIPQLVWISGGIGITPFRSILKQLDFENLDPKITLLYANKTPEICFKLELDDLSGHHPNLRIVYTVDQPILGWQGEVGHITADFIKRCVPDLSKPSFYISGPEPMVLQFIKMLEDMGIDQTKIKRDAFPGYDQEVVSKLIVGIG